MLAMVMAANPKHPGAYYLRQFAEGLREGCGFEETFEQAIEDFLNGKKRNENTE